MAQNMRAVIQFMLLALFLHGAEAQTQPEVAEILKKVSETYKAVSQYELEVDATTNEDGKRVTLHMHFAFKAPDKYRMEGLGPGMSPLGADGYAVIVDDGSVIWFYLPKPNQYGSIPAGALAPNASGDLGDLMPEVMDHFLMWRYRGAPDFTDGAKFLREDSIEIAGAQVACYVVTFLAQKRGLPYTWWVDKKGYRVLREDHAENSALFTSIKLNEPIRDELFRFEAPPGARKVQLLQ